MLRYDTWDIQHQLGMKSMSVGGLFSTDRGVWRIVWMVLYLGSAMNHE